MYSSGSWCISDKSFLKFKILINMNIAFIIFDFRYKYSWTFLIYVCNWWFVSIACFIPIWTCRWTQSINKYFMLNKLTWKWKKINSSRKNIYYFFNSNMVRISGFSLKKFLINFGVALVSITKTLLLWQ
jgi:hypothetical protein